MEGESTSIYADFSWSNKFKILSLIPGTEGADLKSSNSTSNTDTLGTKTIEETWRGAFRYA